VGSNPTVTAIVMSRDIVPDRTHEITIFVVSFLRWFLFGSIIFSLRSSPVAGFTTVTCVLVVKIVISVPA